MATGPKSTEAVIESEPDLLENLGLENIQLENDEDLNPDQRTRLEPIENALNYTIEALTSEDTYFDPVHAANLRNGNESRPLDDIVKRDIREFTELEQDLSDLIEQEKIEAGTQVLKLLRKRNNLERHLENSGLIGDLFQADESKYDVMNHLRGFNQGNKFVDEKMLSRVKMLHESDIEQTEVGLENGVDWKHQAIHLTTAYTNILARTAAKMNEHAELYGVSTRNIEGVSPEITNALLENLGYEEFQNLYLPSQPLDLARDMTEELTQQYSRALKSVSSISSEAKDFENVEKIQTESVGIDWEGFEREYGSSPSEDMKEFYEAAATYQDEDMDIEAELLMKIVADVNGHDVSYEIDEKDLAENFGGLKKAVGQAESFDYQLPVMSKEREAQRIAETVDHVSDFYQREIHELVREV